MRFFVRRADLGQARSPAGRLRVVEYHCGTRLALEARFPVAAAESRPDTPESACQSACESACGSACESACVDCNADGFAELLRRMALSPLGERSDGSPAMLWTTERDGTLVVATVCRRVAAVVDVWLRCGPDAGVAMLRHFCQDIKPRRAAAKT